MYHYATLCSRILNSDLEPVEVTLRTHWGNHDVDWVSRPELAETYAFVRGQATIGIPFSFEVGKYYGEPRNERHFIVHVDEVSAEMLFSDPNLLIIRTPDATCEVALSGNYYEHVSRGFKEFVESGRSEPHGLKEAIRAVRAVDAFRAASRIRSDHP